MWYLETNGSIGAEVESIALSTLALKFIKKGGFRLGIDASILLIDASKMQGSNRVNSFNLVFNLVMDLIAIPGLSLVSIV